MQQKQLREAMTILLREVPTWDVPVVSLIAQESHDPYRVLISTLLSLRTLDQTTGPAAQRLFALADTPEAMLRLEQQTIERTIYPVGFYRNKAVQILEISRRLLDEFGGRVPDDIDVLTTFNGVGRKTANLVLAEGIRHSSHLCGHARAPYFQPLGLCARPKIRSTPRWPCARNSPASTGSPTIPRWWRWASIAASRRRPCAASVR